MLAIDVTAVKESEVLTIDPVQFSVPPQVLAQQQLFQLFQVGDWSVFLGVEFQHFPRSVLQMVCIIGHPIRVQLEGRLILRSTLIFLVDREHGDLFVGEHLVVCVQIKQCIPCQ